MSSGPGPRPGLPPAPPPKRSKTPPPPGRFTDDTDPPPPDTADRVAPKMPGVGSSSGSSELGQVFGAARDRIDQALEDLE